jgi:hypothetical protein
MIFGQQLPIYILLTNIEGMLDDIAIQAGKAEALYAETGETTPATLYTAAQKQAFVDIRAWTKTLITAIAKKELGE